MNQIKKIAGLCFALSFICMAFLFVNVSLFTENKALLKTAFLIFGALGLMFNLLSYNQEKKGTSLINFLFWLGAITIFFGIIFKMFHYPFHTVLLIGGIFISASSFIISKFYKEDEKDDSDLVDQL